MRFAALLAFAIIAPVAAEAMQVSPMSLEMSSLGRDSRNSLEIVNSSPSDLPIEFTVNRIELNENGGVSESDGEADFLIFPQQAMIKPYGRQIVRVQWLGDPDLDASRHYYITAKQVPVENPNPGQYRVNVVVNIRALVSVKPPEGAPDLSVVEARVVPFEEGQARVAALIENRSNVHGSLGQSDIRLEVFDAAGASIWSLRPTPDMRLQRIGVGVVQAHKRRYYTFPYEIPAEIAARAASARVILNAQRPE